MDTTNVDNNMAGLVGELRSDPALGGVYNELVGRNGFYTNDDVISMLIGYVYAFYIILFGYDS